MGIQRTSELASTYYPPRARWYSGLFYLWSKVRRVFHLETVRPPAGLSWPQLAVSLVVPGFAFLALGRRSVGRWLLIAYALAALLFVAALGYQAGNIGFGLMISIHATSLIYLQAPWLRDSLFRFKLLMALATSLIVWLLFYTPLVGLTQRLWIMPLRQNDQVLVVWRGASPDSIKRGDWLAYELVAGRIEGVDLSARPAFLQSGYGVDPVLARPGDHVRFEPTALFVNGQALPRGAYMPLHGELVVPQKKWFVWPTFAISRGAAVAETTISAAILEAAMISREQIIGTPFKYWFGRQQVP